jgi:hypothetical protein
LYRQRCLTSQLGGVRLQARRDFLLRFTRLKAAVIAAGVAAIAFIGSPATAGSVTTFDQFGAVDFDAACLLGTGLDNGTVPEANNIPTPGAPGGSLGVPPGGDGCEVVSTYDGSTAGTDLYEVTMDSTAVTNGPSNVQLGAEFLIAGLAPLPGNNCPTCFDLPNSQFVGAGYKALFQSLNRQNNLPTNPVGGGCPRFPTGTVFDQHGHWLDGYHHFIGIDVVWATTGWMWSAQVGTYDPSPDGAFFFTELGTASSTNSLGQPVWVSADPAAQFGTHWSVTAKVTSGLLLFRVLVDGVLGSANINCANGVFYTVYAKAGDPISNIKGLSTANSTVTLPTTVPLSLIPGFSDITSIGGFISFSDITHGNSTNNGLAGLLATLTGDNPATACVHEGLVVNRLCVSYTSGFFGQFGASDTLGDSPSCPTPTFGGLLPTNPLLNWTVGCQFDDDNIPVPNAGNPTGPWTVINPGERGTFLPEWWDTVLQFTA